MTRLLSVISRHRAIVCIAGLLWICAPVLALAQPPDVVNPEALAADPPAHVSFVDGAAVLERDGQPDSSPANMPLLAGDRLRTQGGRVEILFADGSALHVDANTTVDFQSDELVRLLDGRIRLSIPGPNRRVSYRIDASSASALINEPGEYRLAVLHGAREAEIELAVIRGAAELVNDDGRTPLRAGERAYARANAAPSYAYVFNSASWDSFDRWSEARRDQRLGVSAQYLPEEVRPYAPSFDRYGAWGYEAAYGYVWYPRVSVDWRPYYNGRWVTLRPYGWTWIGIDPWAWPTHHYGRWGISAGTWFWIPGRSWGPAWVSWAYAPGYVSWCPLGWNNRPVLQIVSGYGYGRGYDPWRAWTAVPRRHFGVDYVNVHYVAGRTFDARTRESFVTRYSAPDSGGYAVPRSTAPIRVAGTERSPRPSSPVYTNLEPGASRVGSGGPRVVVGQPRGSVVESTPGRAEREAGLARRSPIDSSARDAGDPGRRNPAAGTPSSNVQRDPSVGRRAVPRESSPYDLLIPSQRTYGSPTQRGVPASPRAEDSAAPGYRDFSRRAPDRSEPGVSPRPEYRPYGTAIPRAPESTRPSSPEARPYGGASPNSPESVRPAAPESRPYGGIERRAPANDRPSGPPPESARPAAPDRSNPGADRNAPAPDNRSAPNQGRARPGGQPSSGGAVRRGGGR
jgi:FecR protein